MAVNVVAVDNAPELLEKIEGIFRNMAEVSLLGSFEEAVAVVEFVKENPVDMVFYYFQRTLKSSEHSMNTKQNLTLGIFPILKNRSGGK